MWYDIGNCKNKKTVQNMELAEGIYMTHADSIMSYEFFKCQKRKTA